MRGQWPIERLSVAHQSFIRAGRDERLVSVRDFLSPSPWPSPCQGEEGRAAPGEVDRYRDDISISVTVWQKRQDQAAKPDRPVSTNRVLQRPQND
jgi:hypothetical protein